MFVAGNSRRW